MASTPTMIVPKHEVLQRAKQGPFRCDHCEYARQDSTKCSNEYIVQHYGADIAPGDCCDLFERDKNKKAEPLSVRSLTKDSKG